MTCADPVVELKRAATHTRSLRPANKKMDDKYFATLISKLDATEKKDEGIDSLFQRAEARCKELYPNHTFVDIFADPSVMQRVGNTGLKPMESILKEDGGWDEALKRFACHSKYSDLMCRVAIPAAE